MRDEMRQTVSIAVVCAMLGLVGVSDRAHAQLPPDSQADRYLLQAEGHIREGEHYGEALELLKEAGTMQKEAEAGKRPLGALMLQPTEAAQQLDGPIDGSIFRDCEDCPEMVILPPGSFAMGCVSGEDCNDDEYPVHDVTFAQPFALGRTEVTFAQWDACVADGGCDDYRPDDSGWGRGDRPVVHVSMNDASAYVFWLSQKTGAEYRLPSEAQWEYGARAGTTTAYSWGDVPDSRRANGGSDWPNDGYDETAPVGSFEANPFGLHDMHGNVSEWVADCWNESYDGAPSDGSAWESGDCSYRVLRSGSWVHGRTILRSANRNWNTNNNRENINGFRVARALAP